MKEILAHKKIRFGLMCESPKLKAWEADCINKALANKKINLELLIYPFMQSQFKKSDNAKKLARSKESKGLFSFLLNKSFIQAECNSFIDLSKKFGNVPSITCQTINKDSSEHFSPQDTKTIKNAKLDFIIIFSGFDNIRGEILKTSKFGIWSFHHGDIKKYSGTPPSFWEIYNKENITGAVLQKLSEKDDKALIIKKGYFKTLTQSYKENLNHVYFESAGFLNEICNELLNGSSFATKEVKLDREVQKYSLPSEMQIIKFFFILTKYKTKKLLNNIFFVEQWNIGYINSPIETLLETDREPEIKWIMHPRRNEFFADPFILGSMEANYIFYENFNYKKNKANIACISPKPGLSSRDAEVSFDRPYHLSYPFVFQHDEDIYMIPGEWEINRASLYKAKTFPTGWERSVILIKNISVVDPTLVKHDGFWWLFFTQKTQSPDTRLYIYYAEDLFGPWKSHRKNPVKTDISSARPAGRLFCWKESLIRPAQDSSETYGGRIVFNKITKLTPEEFEEHPIKYFTHRQKESFNKGMHTINSVGHLTVIDGKRFIPSLSNIKKTTRKKLSRKCPLKSKSYKYAYMSRPKYVERKKYTESIDRALISLIEQQGIRSIYHVGSINYPGISDIDINVVFEDKLQSNYNPRISLKGTDEYLFTHNIGGICETQFRSNEKFMLYHNVNLLWGKEIRAGKENLSEAENNAIKIQTGLEYLISYFIDLTVQRKYKVVKLRTLFQHIKAIKYDLDYLNVSSGAVYEMVHELTDRMNTWFDKPQYLYEINKWINKFYLEYKEFLERFLNKYSFYIPEWANLKIARNLRLQFGKCLDCQFTGFTLPKSISKIHKKAFNLNNRINSFQFAIPFSTVPPHTILEERAIMAKKMKKYNQKNLPFFTPLISGFLFKAV